MTAAAEALLTLHREPLAPSGASFASRLVCGLAASRVPMLARALAALRALAPYAAIELLLPGGSLVALVLWLYRRYKKATPAAG
jgi:hypothetical protein